MINWRDGIVHTDQGCNRRKMQFHNCGTPTHCDYCANACGFCSWSKKGVQRPVPGWDAVRLDIHVPGDRSIIESYIVIGCPEFVLEKHWDSVYRAVDWEKVRRKAMVKGGNL